jgi:uncharacterized protein (TIGR04255 family)
MASIRKCRTEKLSKQPLALVLIQVRFSPISNMDSYIAGIQDDLRRNGYPLFTPQKTYSIELSPDGDGKRNELPQWRFDTADRRSSVILDGGQVLLQTANYEDFETFYAEFARVFSSVMAQTEHSKFGIIQRLGLRYIDQVAKQDEADTIDSYLRPELRGMASERFSKQQKQYAINILWRIPVGLDKQGTLSIRVYRGIGIGDLPLDVSVNAPVHRVLSNKDDVALVDIDHSWDGEIGPGFDDSSIEELFFNLHDTVIETFHESVVTPEGIAKWR